MLGVGRFERHRDAARLVDAMTDAPPFGSLERMAVPLAVIPRIADALAARLDRLRIARWRAIPDA